MDAFYSPFTYPNGRQIYGTAAFNHRVKMMGGPTNFAYATVRMMDAQINASAANSNRKVVPLRRKAG